MRSVVLDHPLAAAWLTALRDETTGPELFRELVDRLSFALAWEALRDAVTRPIEVRTPLTAATGVALAGGRPLLVPILRAGLWMLDGPLRLVGDAEVSMLGMARNEVTLEPLTYLDHLPPAMDPDRPVFVLDPMLATGGSLCAAGRLLAARGVTTATALCVLAAPEGLARVGAELPTWTVVTAAVDDHLDGRGFIVPGLGDAGDRLCG